MKKQDSLSNRTDISDFIIHLTRDNEGKTAEENLTNILNEMKVEARAHHCLFNGSLNKQSDVIRKKYHVACFTETPIHKLQDIFNIKNKQKDFKPYGIIFSKDSLKDYEECGMEDLANHPNPVFYASGDNKALVKSLYQQYDKWLDDQNNSIENNFHVFGSLVNLVNDKHNFIWEREWRTVGDYKFIIPDIIAVIAPESQHDNIRNNVYYEFSEAITFIDISWSLEKQLSKISTFAWNNWYKYNSTLRKLNELKETNKILDDE